MHNTITNFNNGESKLMLEQTNDLQDANTVQIFSDLEQPNNVYSDITERNIVKKKKKKKVKRLRERSQEINY